MKDWILFIPVFFGLLGFFLIVAGVASQLLRDDDEEDGKY